MKEKLAATLRDHGLDALVVANMRLKGTTAFLPFASAADAVDAIAKRPGSCLLCSSQTLRLGPDEKGWRAELEKLSLHSQRIAVSRPSSDVRGTKVLLDRTLQGNGIRPLTIRYGATKNFAYADFTKESHEALLQLGPEDMAPFSIAHQRPESSRIFVGNLPSEKGNVLKPALTSLMTSLRLALPQEWEFKTNYAFLSFSHPDNPDLAKTVIEKLNFAELCLDEGRRRILLSANHSGGADPPQWHKVHVSGISPRPVDEIRRQIAEQLKPRPQGVQVRVYPDGKTSLQYAFAVYTKRADAEAAAAGTDQSFPYALTPVGEQAGEKPRVFFPNLPRRLTEEDLLQCVLPYGFALSTQIPHFESGDARGYGFATMDSVEAQQRLVMAAEQGLLRIGNHVLHVHLGDDRRQDGDWTRGYTAASRQKSRLCAGSHDITLPLADVSQIGSDEALHLACDKLAELTGQTGHGTIKSIRVDHVKGDAMIDQVAACLRPGAFVNLVSLCLFDARLTGRAGEDLASAVGASQTLKELSLCRSQLDLAFVEKLADSCLQREGGLQELNLGSCKVAQTTGSIAEKLLPHCQHLHHLILFHQPHMGSGLVFSDWAPLVALKELVLSYNTRLWQSVLCQPPQPHLPSSLQTLDLSKTSNRINKLPLRTLSEALPATLETLLLAQNVFAEDSLSAFCKKLPALTQLRVLALHNTYLADDDMIRILDAIQDLQHVAQLS